MRSLFSNLNIAASVHRKLLHGLFGLLVLSPMLLNGCSNDCVYKYDENSDGEEFCFRFCPKVDEETGEEVVDADDFPVLEREDLVDPINCEGIDLVGTTDTTTTDTTSATTTN